MLKRLLTAILIVAVLVGFTMLRMVNLAFFDVFVLLLMFAAAYEFIKASKAQNLVIFERLVAFYPIPVFVGYVFTDSLVSAMFIQLLTLLVIFLVSMGIELILYAARRKNFPPVENQDLLSVTKNTIKVIIYPLSVISCMFIINHFGQYFEIHNIGYVLIILSFGVSMATDTFAYVFGILFGKKSAKLSPEISPNKTVVGAVSGLVGGMIVGIVCWILFYKFNILDTNLQLILSTSSSVALFSMIGLVGSLATQLGDLLASATKRKANIKDFSKLLPGHGGIMDRIDGSIFCAMIVTVFFTLFICL